MTATLYRHSNKAPILGLAAGAAATFVAGPMLAAVYALAIAYIPIIYINIVATALFGAAIGFLVAYAMKTGKVRNTWLTVGAALLGTAFVHYVGWMIWVALAFWRADAEVPMLAIIFPPSFIAIVIEIGSMGTWGVRNSAPVSGVLLWVVWTVEALIVFGASLAVAFGTADSEPFCEQCESWCQSEGVVLRLTGNADGDALASRLTAGDLGGLSELPAATQEDNPWHQIELCVCGSCGGTNTLTLSRVTMSWDKKGKPSESKDALVERMLITREQVEWLKQLAAHHAQPLAASA
jgi:hypothetical protein